MGDPAVAVEFGCQTLNATVSGFDLYVYNNTSSVRTQIRVSWVATR